MPLGGLGERANRRLHDLATRSQVSARSHLWEPWKPITCQLCGRSALREDGAKSPQYSLDKAAKRTPYRRANSGLALSRLIELQIASSWLGLSFGWESFGFSGPAHNGSAELR